jgi:glucan phosphoethanolaminetransferase (alkaline phosphatase superfamily)
MEINNFIFLFYLTLFIKNNKIIFLYFFKLLLKAIASFLLLIPLISIYIITFNLYCNFQLPPNKYNYNFKSYI